MDSDKIFRRDIALSSFIIMATLFLLTLIKFTGHINITTDEAIVFKIPILFWILILIIPGLIVLNLTITRDKKVCLIMSVLYFIVVYSYHLFFIIPSFQTDMGATGYFITLMDGSATIPVEKYDYFQWPLFFTFLMVLQNVLGLSYISLIALSFFSLLVMIPVFLSLFFSSKTPGYYYFIFPVSFLILTIYFLNDQMVPQFLGYIYLILAMGCYLKYQEKKSKLHYCLMLLFYGVCVFTHPFVFIFLPVALLLEGVIPKLKMKGIKRCTERISIIPFMVIYAFGFLYRFMKIQSVLHKMFYASDGRGESWFILSYLIGDKEQVGVISYSTHPLFHLLSNEIYLVSRYSTMLILLVFGIILLYSFYKSRKNIESFDILIAISGGLWFIAGLVVPAILGQRAFQVIFLTTSRYITHTYLKNRVVTILILFILIVFPLAFTSNVAINHSISGGQFIEDENTIAPGLFIDNYGDYNTTVFVADRFLYPSGVPQEKTLLRRPPEYIVSNKTDIASIDMVIITPKLENRLIFYGLSEISYGNQTDRVYDMGESSIIHINKSV